MNETTDAGSVTASFALEGTMCSARIMERQKEESQMAKNEKSVEDRRGFLKLASLGTVLGGAALATGGSAQAAEVIDESGSGYRETAHVNTYYESTRF